MRIKLFVKWYMQLIRQGYSKIWCIDYAWYNSKYFNLDGTELNKNG